MSIAKEFKEFVCRGNVVDMAVGVIIGGKFGAIVSSLVNDVIMPPIGYALGGVDFTELKIVLAAATETTEEVAIKYGAFINNIIDFLIVAAVIFAVVKAINQLRKKPEEAPAPEEPKGPTTEELLTEIRDMMKKQ